MALFVAFFPDGDDLVDCDIANIAIIILQVQDAILHLSHVTAQARSGATKDIDAASRQCFQEFFHLS